MPRAGEDEGSGGPMTSVSLYVTVRSSRAHLYLAGSATTAADDNVDDEEERERERGRDIRGKIEGMMTWPSPLYFSIFNRTCEFHGFSDFVNATWVPYRPKPSSKLFWDLICTDFGI